MIRVLVALCPPSNADKGNKLIDTAFATAMHASQCASNSQLNFYSPGALVFHRDILLDIPLHADLILLNKFRQNKINQRLLKANAKHIAKDYQVGDQIYCLTA